LQCFAVCCNPTNTSKCASIRIHTYLSDPPSPLPPPANNPDAKHDYATN